MTTNKFKNRLFGRTRGRSKKKIDIKNYLSKLEKYKLPKFDKNINYILDIGTGYGETSIYLSKYLMFFPLVITYFIGPLGIFIYWIIRMFYAKKISLYE